MFVLFLIKDLMWGTSPSSETLIFILTLWDKSEFHSYLHKFIAKKLIFRNLSLSLLYFHLFYLWCPIVFSCTDYIFWPLFGSPCCPWDPITSLFSPFLTLVAILWMLFLPWQDPISRPPSPIASLQTLPQTHIRPTVLLICCTWNHFTKEGLNSPSYLHIVFWWQNVILWCADDILIIYRISLHCKKHNFTVFFT